MFVKTSPPRKSFYIRLLIILITLTLIVTLHRYRKAKTSTPRFCLIGQRFQSPLWWTAPVRQWQEPIESPATNSLQGVSSSPSSPSSPIIVIILASSSSLLKHSHHHHHRVRHHQRHHPHHIPIPGSPIGTVSLRDGHVGEQFGFDCDSCPTSNGVQMVTVPVQI